MLKIEGHRQNYDWGSTTAIQQLAGLPVDGLPLAELWFGTHPSGETVTETGESLAEHVSVDILSTLGNDVAERFGPVLPFLVKYLAPGRAVSLQVHPSADYAKRGFAFERVNGGSDGVHRFADANHKPEMVFAVTAFDGLVGFRRPDEAAESLALFAHPALARAGHVLATAPNGLAAAFELLARLSRTEVDSIMAEARMLSARWSDSSVTTIVELAEQYPGDAGTVAAILLDRVSLAPGAAVFVPSGVPHAYLSGLALEIMANSDNVFRAGMTTKQVSLTEVLDNLRTDPPQVFASSSVGPVWSIEPDAAEFALAVVDLDILAERSVDGQSPVVLRIAGPRIVLSLAGDVTVGIDTSEQRREIRPAEGVFVDASDGPIILTGHGRVVVAFVPEA